MPLVTIKAPEGAFTPQQQREMLDRVTEAMIEVEGESFRDKTWVLYEEVPAGQWAIGGSIVGVVSTG
jgi:4-oxalocrotonate tautomerase